MESVLIRENDFQKTRKKIRESKKSGKQVIFSSASDDLNRKVLEKEDIDILLINLAGRKDRMKQRDSGFNHVLAKLAKKNRVILGTNLDEVLKSHGKAKSELLARMRQNIKLANKNKLNMKFISKEKKDIRDLKALGLALGMPTKMTKNL